MATQTQAKHYEEIKLPSFITWPEVTTFAVSPQTFVHHSAISVPALKDRKEYFKTFFTTEDPNLLNEFVEHLGISWVVFAVMTDAYYSQDVEKYILTPAKHSFDPMVNFVCWFRHKELASYRAPLNLASYGPKNPVPIAASQPQFSDLVRALIAVANAMAEAYVFNIEDSWVADKNKFNRFVQALSGYCSHLRGLISILDVLTEELISEVLLPISTNAYAILPSSVPSNHPQIHEVLKLLITKRPAIKETLLKCFYFPGVDTDMYLPVILSLITPEFLSVLKNDYPIPYRMMRQINYIPFT